MKKYSRRDFLKQIGAFAGLALVSRSAPAASPVQSAEAFDFLVVGDSLVWGQGLREEQKFYYLTKRWLESEILPAARTVRLKVKAHSGASLNLRQYETDALLDAEISETEFFHPEINLSFPSIRAQLDVARREYENPETVDLLLLTGGVTDIRLTTILNPLKNNDELKADIKRHCSEKMFELLEHAARSFPNALIAVAGYYPFLSKHTPTSTIFNSLLELNEIPDPLKILINNPLNRNLLKRYRRKMVERSRIWANDSTVEFQKAVDRLNEKSGGRRAVFISSPLTEENSIGAPNALLFDITKNGRAKDALALERKTACRETLENLRRLTRLKLKNRTCELATIGHPTPDGAKAYAAAIREKLAPFLTG